MKKLIIAGLFAVMASAFMPATTSAGLLSGDLRAPPSNPYDAKAQMRDPSSYGSPAAGRMRSGMNRRPMMRNRMMMRRSMMRGNRMGRSVRDPSKFGGSTARRAR